MSPQVRPGTVAATRLAAVETVIASRWWYELFAGLEQAGLDASEQHWVNVLRLLGRDDLGRGAIVLEQLGALTRETVRRLVTRYRDEDLTFRGLRFREGEAATPGLWS